jgi:hypothetical protein
LSPYDPKSALKLVRDALKAKPTKPKGLLDGFGAPTAYEASERPRTFCFLLSAFAGDTAVMPDDFDTVPKSAKGIKEHVRPDGAVFLGLFETPNGRDQGVVVFGDPLMDLQDAISASLAFRGKVLSQMDTFDRHKNLGPFAASERLPHE